MNPVAQIRTTVVSTGPGDNDYKPAYRSVETFCPGCSSRHPFRIEVFDGYTDRANGEPLPVWEWDGNLERPTFSPSMLAGHSVHLCPEDYVHVRECTGDCQKPAHGLYWKHPDGRLEPSTADRRKPRGAVKVETHWLPHAVDPAYGDCHSYLRDGRWEFLADSAHQLAGQTVDMVPLPDWIVRR